MATLNVKGFPDALYQKLKRQAKREGRSVASEVRILLAEELTRPRIGANDEFRATDAGSGRPTPPKRSR